MIYFVDDFKLAKQCISNQLYKLCYCEFSDNLFARIEILNLYKNEIPVSDVYEISLEIKYEKLIFSYWKSGFSRVWTIKSYSIFPEYLLLNVISRLNKSSNQIIISSSESKKSYISVIDRRKITSQKFLLSLKKYFPGIKILHSRIGNFSKSISLHFTYVWTIYKGINHLFICVNDFDSTEIINGILTAALESFSKIPKKQIEFPQKISIFVPKEYSTVISKRLTLLKCKIDLYEIESNFADITLVKDLEDLFYYRKSENRSAWRSVELVLTTAEKEIISDIWLMGADYITFQRSSNNLYLSIRWLGLEFARLQRQTSKFLPVLYFGISAIHQATQKYSSNTKASFFKLISDLLLYRTEQMKNTSHILYKLQSERWLESIICKSIQCLDPRLNQNYVYNQMPTYTNSGVKYIDILSVTIEGQLAILELKTREDRELLWQGIDYWKRVEFHLKQNDFVKRGYFTKNLVKEDLPPILFLVAPLLRFSKNLKEMCSWLNDSIPIRIITLNQQWRKELKVINYHSIN